MLTTVKTFRDPWEAHMFRSRLAAEGVPAFVANDGHVWMKWPISTALGGVRVQVPGRFADQAEAILGRCASGEYRAELAALFGEAESRRCPRCGAQDSKRRPSVQQVLFGLAVLHLFGIAVKVEARRCTCRVCGARWRETDAS